MKKRHFLLGGLAIFGGLAWWQRNPIVGVLTRQIRNKEVDLLSQSVTTSSCLLTPESMEGPFFVQGPLRQDIREEQVGLPLELIFQVVELDGCTAVENASVEIWHCNNAGVYSAYPDNLSRKPFDTMLLVAMGDETGNVTPTNDKTYLRGAQITDEFGMVRFKTNFPGWYELRAPHIHLKVSVGDKAWLTTQLYFPEELSSEIYAEHPDYSPYGPCPYHHGNDLVINHAKGKGVLLDWEKQSDGISAGTKIVLS